VGENRRNDAIELQNRKREKGREEGTNQTKYHTGTTTTTTNGGTTETTQ